MCYLACVKGYESKKCFYCHSPIIKRNGKKNGIQQYKCHVCGRQFSGGFRIDDAQLWKEYTEGKQTYIQLSNQYGCSVKTIQRRMDKHVVSKRTPSVRSVIVLMDTTYWGRSFGVMLFKDSLTGENPLKYYVKHETNAIDGHFADLKNKLRNHNGLNLERKKKFIDGFFKGYNTL